MRRSLLRGGLAVVAVAVAFAPAAASTDGSPANWALSEFGGAPAQRQMLYSGTPGVLMGTSPASLLFIGWRRLHGQTVSTAAGEALAVPCCGDTSAADPTAAWLDARKAVPGVAALNAPLSTDRPGPDYTSIPNCLADAFGNATRTLQARIASYGADSPDVRSWLAAQDAVFAACAAAVASLPALPDAAPAWLRADHQYQAAALDFYNGAYGAAAAVSPPSPPTQRRPGTTSRPTCGCVPCCGRRWRPMLQPTSPRHRMRRGQCPRRPSWRTWPSCTPTRMRRPRRAWWPLWGCQS